MMAHETVLSTIESLINARRLKDYGAAWACYEPSASVVLQPGHIETGESAIKAFIKGASDLALRFEGHQVIESGDFALHLSKYTIDTGANGLIHGRTADVFHRQADGRWLIVIDNPWAGAD
jgi:ketosteroid isomerase-like protein